MILASQKYCLELVYGTLESIAENLRAAQPPLGYTILRSGMKKDPFKEALYSVWNKKPIGLGLYSHRAK